jgi:hypothetical protein
MKTHQGNPPQTNGLYQLKYSVKPFCNFFRKRFFKNDFISILNKNKKLSSSFQIVRTNITIFKPWPDKTFDSRIVAKPESRFKHEKPIFLIFGVVYL